MLVVPFAGLGGIAGGCCSSSLWERWWSSSGDVGAEEIPAYFWFILGIVEADA